jgi:hypothetical protein
MRRAEGFAGDAEMQTLWHIPGAPAVRRFAGPPVVGDAGLLQRR